ncbi:hypothetical protein NBH00_24945 [Paraconexibacter antarcticus]|uniref:Repeat protein (TIGR01451 family) n=1 Tax=Paraconexibacter antarcticus TaxID=2949664 RepID=A0ABY5DVK1_9ACTN|nr:hypothetical protein [Paraconexibacter antarcticus]UTI64569.1 hypothetical protein NBH00_24945 [Paraconexibacter antarcticus]
MKTPFGDAATPGTQFDKSDEQNPTSWNLTAGEPSTAKNDITAATTYLERRNGRVYLHVGFTTKSDAGSANILVELNRNATGTPGALNSFAPDRSQNDALIQFSGNQNQAARIGLCRWVGSRSGQGANSTYGWYQVDASGQVPQVAPPASATPTTNLITSSNKDCTALDPSVAVGRVNAAALVNTDQGAPNGFPVPAPPFASPTIAAGTFGEFSIDLTTALGAGSANPCFDFGSIWLHTYNGNSIASIMEDYVAPHTVVGASSCAVTVDKKVAVSTSSSVPPPTGDFIDGTADTSLANDGDWLWYRLAVKNTESVALDGVNIDDPNCQIVDTAGNASNAPIDKGNGDAVFDPGETWTYLCKHQLVAGDGATYTNTVTATGTKGTFTTAPATDSVTTGRYGKVLVTKVNVGGDPADTFGFTPSGDLVGNSAATPALVPVVNTFSLIGGGTQTFTSVKPNASSGAIYTVSEAALATYTLTDLTCTTTDGKTSDTDTSTAGGVATIKVSANETVTCTFTNTRNTGTLTVNKTLVPAADPGKFDLQIDGTTAGTGGNVGNGGTTGAQTLNTGSYGVGEAGAGTTKLSDYAASTHCVDKAGAAVPLAAGKVAVTTGSEIVCTITNTRKTGTLEVKKVLSPAADPGKFDLQIDGATKSPAGGVGDGGTTGAQNLNTGSYGVGEVAHTGTSLSDYTASITCVDGKTTVVPATAATSVAAVPVADGSTVVCTITNTRNTGTLTVNKTLVPAADPGKFDLQIDGTTAGTGGNVGNGGTTGAQTLNTGSYGVGEAGAGTTKLSDYAASTACVDQANGGAAVPLVAGKVAVTTGSDIVCTITNTRKTGTLEVEKVLSPAADPGKFDLQIDGATKSPAGGVGDGGTTGAQTLNTGDHTVGEAGAGTTKLSDYAASTHCVDNANGGATVSSTGGTVAVTKSADIVCTITNTRSPGNLTVNKTLVPAADPGKFDLQIDGATAGTGGAVGDGGTTGAIPLAPGSYAVGEAGAGTTDLADYTASTACVDQANGGAAVPVAAGKVAVTTGSEIVCTITNTRNTGTLTVNKTLVPAADPGKFDLQIDGATKSPAGGVGDGGTTGAQTLNTGSYGVGEAGAGTTKLSDYAASTHCVDKAGAAVPLVAGKVAVTTGSEIVCTITNTRKTGTLEVKKVLSPAADPGKFDLQIDGTTAGTGGNVGNGGTTGAQTLNTGSYGVGEVAHTGTSLSDYTASITCVDGKTTVVPATAATSVAAVPVADGSTVVCTITNTRKPVVIGGGGGGAPAKATVTIKKVTDPAGGSTQFPFTSSLPQGGGVAADGSFALADGSSVTTQVDAGTYSVSEKDPHGLGYKLAALACTESGDQNTTVPAAGTVSTSRTASVHAEAGETITCTFTNRKIVSQAVVVKAGDSFAYHGDTVSYTFSVTNPGNNPLHDVHVSDDKCPNVSSSPTSKLNDNGDAFLDPGETWIFTCSYAIGSHQTGEANPIVNTATVTGQDESGDPVTASDKHSTQILHQALALAKTGPATAAAGDRVAYTLKLTNIGDTSFARTSLNVTDALCDAPPLLTSTGGDSSPNSLDPGDVWLYTCSVASVAGQTAIHNVADVAGTDVHSRTATAEATANTLLTNVSPIVAQSAPKPGTAKLRGTTGCIPTAARIFVTGSKIKSVTYRVDGKVYRKLVTANGSGHRYLIVVPAGTVTYGTHRVTATIVFTAASRTKTKTLTMIITRCRPPKPHFTG